MDALCTILRIPCCELYHRPSGLHELYDQFVALALKYGSDIYKVVSVSGVVVVVVVVVVAVHGGDDDDNDQAVLI